MDCESLPGMEFRGAPPVFKRQPGVIVCSTLTSVSADCLQLAEGSTRSSLNSEGIPRAKFQISLRSSQGVGALAGEASIPGC